MKQFFMLALASLVFPSLIAQTPQRNYLDDPALVGFQQPKDLPGRDKVLDLDDRPPDVHVAKLGDLGGAIGAALLLRSEG